MILAPDAGGRCSHPQSPSDPPPSKARTELGAEPRLDGLGATSGNDQPPPPTHHVPGSKLSGNRQHRERERNLSRDTVWTRASI